MPGLTDIKNMTPSIQSTGFAPISNIEISTDRYEVRFAQTQKDIDSALRLRHKVFNVELAKEHADEEGLEFDLFDYQCRHLIVVEKLTQQTVGTYRVNTIEAAKKVSGFYSFGEFSIEDLPAEVLKRSVEIGRACIAAEHRNTRVLLLLWKGLAKFLNETDKVFLFGCCSIFSTDCEVGLKTYDKLKALNLIHSEYRVTPRADKACGTPSQTAIARETGPEIELPALFNMYLRIGAKICGTPVLDCNFGTIDFFVIFDKRTLNGQYRQMFLGGREADSFLN